MSISTIDIYNLALGELGGDQLSSVQSPQEDSDVARLCGLFYPQALRVTLEARNWRFARKTEEMAYLGEGDIDYPFRFALPADCINPVRIAGFPEDRPAHWKLHGREIWTPVNPASLEYVRSVDDASLFPAYFVEALKYALAEKLAIGRRNEDGLRQSMKASFLEALGVAEVRDASLARRGPAVSRWISTRR